MTQSEEGAIELFSKLENDGFPQIIIDTAVEVNLCPYFCLENKDKLLKYCTFNRDGCITIGIETQQEQEAVDILKGNSFLMGLLNKASTPANRGTAMTWLQLIRRDLRLAPKNNTGFGTGLVKGPDGKTIVTRYYATVYESKFRIPTYEPTVLLDVPDLDKLKNINGDIGTKVTIS